MGIAKSQFNNILSGIFTEGNTIHLLKTMPGEDESGAVRVSGTGYEGYTIKSGDFSVSGGVAKSVKNMMFYLCETAGGHGTAAGFGVYSGSTLLYFGEFKTPMTIGYNTVPTIKKYNGSDEGVQITMVSTDISATAE